MGLLSCFCFKDPEPGQEAVKKQKGSRAKAGGTTTKPVQTRGPGPVESDGIRHDHHASLEAKQRHALHTDTQSPASQAGREKSLPSSATMQHTMNGTAQQVDQHKHAAVPDHHVEVLTAVDPDEILHSCPSVGAESEEWADAEFMSCRTSFTSVRSFMSMDYQQHVTATAAHRHTALQDGHKHDVTGPVDQVKHRAHGGTGPHADGQVDGAKAYPAPVHSTMGTSAAQQHTAFPATAVSKGVGHSSSAVAATGPQGAVTSSRHTAEPAPAEGRSQAGSLVDVLQEALQVYKQQGGACGASKVLLKHCNARGQPLSSLQGSIEQLSSREDQATMRRLLHSSIAMHDLVDQVKDDSGWTVVRDDALKLMYRHEPGTTVHCFKARCILDCPLEQPMCLAREFDLARTWNKYCLESIVLHEWSMAELLCLAVLWMPWPFPNANLMVQAVGQDLLEEKGCFLATLESPHPVPEEGVIPDRLKGNARVYVRPGSCMCYEPLPPATSSSPEKQAQKRNKQQQSGGTSPRDEDGASAGVSGQRALCSVIINIDPCIKNVPEFIITFILRVLAPFMYTMVVKLVEGAFKDPKSAMAQRLRQRSELYGFIRSRTNRFLQRQQLHQQ